MIATTETPADRSAWTAGRLYLLVLLATMALYTLTAQRGAAWQDSGMHQWRGWLGQLHNPLGLALAHPLYIVMAHPLRYVTGTSFATALNMLSGVGMAIAVANTFLLGWWLTRRRAAAVLAAAMLALAHTPWWLGTIAETYTWVVAGLSAELILLIWCLSLPRWWKLALLGLVNGLGLSMHNFALLALPVYGIAALVLSLRGPLRPWSLAAFIGAWLVGAGLYLGLIVDHGLATGDWGATLRSALFGEAWQQEVVGTNLHAVGRAAVYVGLNWPFLSLVPVLVGWWMMPHRVTRPVGVALGAVAAIHIVFAARYAVEDQFMFMLPTYLLLALGAAVGLDWLLARSKGPRRVLLWLVLASVALTPVLYGVTPAVLAAQGRSIRPGRHTPFRDEDRYWITPWKHNEHSARTFAFSVLGAAEPDAVVVADGTARYPLLVTQAVHRYRLDVALAERDAIVALHREPGAFLAAAEGRTVYLAVSDPSFVPEPLLAVAVAEPVIEGLYRIEPRGE